MGDEQQHCVITGCIASNLLDKPTYIGKFQNDDQKFELTIPYARIMSTRLKGKPLDAEHMVGNGTIGTILHSWVEGKKWFIQALVDQSTPAGIDMVKAISGGHGNPFPERIGELSLQHCGFDPVGVAVVVRGARDGCTIDNASLVTEEDLQAIKQQQYNIDDITVPEHFPSGAPRIAASFGEMSNMHYHALRNPAPNVTYQPGATPPETEEIMKTIQNNEQEVARQKASTAAATAAAAAAQQRSRNPEERRKELMEELAKLGPAAGQSQGSAQWSNTGDAQRTGNPQFDGLLDRLHNGHAADAGAGNAPTSNQHTLYSNPQDDAEARLREIAGVFDARIPSAQQKEHAARALLEVAQRTKADREALAQKDLQLQVLAKKLNESESRNSSHQADIEKQRKQAAMMLKRLIQKNTPQATPSEEQELEAGVSDMSEGKTDEGIQKLMPAMIRASAFCDVRDSAPSMEDEDGRYSKMMNKALGLPAQGLISASGANRKRTYESTRYSGPDIPAAAASSNWEKSAASDIPPELAAMMAHMTNNPEFDTEKVQLPQNNKVHRRG